MPAVTLSNFAVYLLHVTALVAIGIGLPAVFGLASPRARALHYRVVLIVALGLPLASPITPPAESVRPAWLRAMGPGAQPVASLAGAPPAPAPSGGPSPAASATRPAGPALLGVIVAGLLARLAWVAAGFRRLRRLRRGAVCLQPRPLPIREAVALAGADADIRLSTTIATPVNFGARRPTILLPQEVQAFPDQEQRAVACHELVHVKRHDWLRTVGDEIVRAIFWFHPAVWWLLDHIHLAREQVVDREVVEITGSRRPYLESLVRLAQPAARPALRPASSLLRRAHLEQRVTLLLKEAVMSKMRVVGGLVATTSMLLAASALVVWVLPLQAAPSDAGPPAGPSLGPLAIETSAAAETPQEGRAGARPQPKLVSSVKPVYPPEARAKGIKGVVILEARIDTAGQVSDVKVLRSIPALDHAAIDAVRQWRYEPQPIEMVFTITVRFQPDGEQAPATAAAKPGARATGAQATPRQPQPKLVSSVKPVYPPEARAKGIKGVVILEARIDTAGQVSDVKVLRSIPALDQAAIDAVRQWRYEPQPIEMVFTITVRFQPDGPRDQLSR